MTILEYAISADRADLEFDTKLNIIMTSLYTESISDIKESVKDFFNRLNLIFHGYLEQRKEIHRLYKEKKELNKRLMYIEKLVKRPSLKDETIVLRGYNKKLVETKDLDEQIQFLKNMYINTKMKYSKSEQDIYYFFNAYMRNRSGWDTFYKVKLGSIPSMFEFTEKSIDEKIATLEDTLHDFEHYLVNDDKKSDEEKKNILKVVIEAIKKSVSHMYDVWVMNIEAIDYEMHNIAFNKVNTDAEKLIKEVSYKEKMKTSKKVMDITYGDDTYEVFETQYPNISCFNYGGYHIYTDKGFFDLPKGYQLAILYHEIGHHQCQHFKPSKESDYNKITVEDEEALRVRIKKDLNMFMMYINTVSNFRSKAYEDGSEFIYLLTEWDADRFAAKRVGKNLVRKALTNRFDKMLDNDPELSSPKNRKLKEYNKDRMHLRTYVI